MHQQFIGKLLKEIAEAVGVRKDIRVSPHTCRHGYDYSRKGVSITSIPETAEAKLAFLLRNSLGLDNQVDCLLLMEISM